MYGGSYPITKFLIGVGYMGMYSVHVRRVLSYNEGQSHLIGGEGL